MNAFLKGLLGLGFPRLAMLGATALLLIGSVLGLSFFAGAPAPTVLYSNLSLTDSASAVAVLQSDHIAYTLSDGGQTILVPGSSLDTARLALAAKICRAADLRAIPYSIILQPLPIRTFSITSTRLAP